MLKALVVLVTLAVDAISLGLLLHPGLGSPTQGTGASHAASATAPYALETATSGLPVRLTIPKIKVDALVEQVKLTPAGAMDAPLGPTGVGWFALGPRPGEKGSAVMDGHFGWKNAIPAVFDDLHTLQKGDRVYVEDAQGVTTTFVVRAIKTYGQDGYPPDVFSSTDGGVHLNLITCGGVWNKDQKSYSNRLIVFTDKE